MPELPEVETTRRGLLDAMTGRSIASARVHDRRLRWAIQDDFEERLAGARIETLTRRAKYLLVATDRGTIIIHLGMSGNLRVVPADLPTRLHDHVEFILDDGFHRRASFPGESWPKSGDQGVFDECSPGRRGRQYLR